MNIHIGILSSLIVVQVGNPDWSDQDDNETDQRADEPTESQYEYECESDCEFDAMCSSQSNSGAKRGRKRYITSRLASALDNAKVSDGMATHILIAAAEALGHRVEELAVNRSTIHRLRQENRELQSNEIKESFNEIVMEFQVQFKVKFLYSFLYIIYS